MADVSCERRSLVSRHVLPGLSAMVIWYPTYYVSNKITRILAIYMIIDIKVIQNFEKL